MVGLYLKFLWVKFSLKAGEQHFQCGKFLGASANRKFDAGYGYCLPIKILRGFGL
jgi:hypothetical protein